MNEYEVMLQRIQNIQNEMLNKQTTEFRKLLLLNSKIFHKYNIDIERLIQDFM